jgi:hypothetical protein
MKFKAYLIDPGEKFLEKSIFTEYDCVGIFRGRMK